MARSFFIARASANSEDPTALEFFPPKGSDELHEALKEAFPFEANLAARMRAAVIEFLLQEQQADLTPVSSEYLPSPQSTFTTMPSPSIGTSFMSQEASPSRRESVAAGQPSQEALMDVWSLPNKPMAKVHTRRTMTSEEKKAYKQKRLIGACADCKRRRRKCDHNNASGGSSIVPQKVGKHKKRVSTAAPAQKADAPVDFSWSAPAFNFEDALGSNAMGSEVPSFDFGATDFNFSPDLSDDWQLFPDLLMVNNFIDTWSTDHSHYDTSMYAPRANMSQSRVSTGPDFMGMLSHDVHGQPALNSGESYGGTYGTNVFGTNTIGNTPISPITPVSLSPMSRTQSASGQTQHNNSSASPNDFSGYSVGAHVEQSGVSRDKPIQVPLDGPDLTTCPYAHLLQPGGAQNNVSRQSTTASTSNSAVIQTNVRTSLQTSDSSDAQFYDRGRLRQQVSSSSQAIVAPPSRIDHRSDAEALLVIEGLLKRTRDSHTSSLAETCRTSENATLSATRSTSSEETQSTMSRLRSITQRENLQSRRSSRILESIDSISNVSSQDRSVMNSEHSEKSHGKVASLPRQNTTTRSQTALSLGHAPVSLAMYAAYQATAQFSSALAVLATLLLGAILISMQLSSVDGNNKSPWAPMSTILQYCTGLPAQSHGLLDRDSRHDASASHCQASRSSSWAKSISSHIGLRRATVMV